MPLHIKPQNVAIGFSFQVSRRFLLKKEKGTWNIFEDGINIKMIATFYFLFSRK